MSFLVAGYIAGLFTTISPCVLPALPIVVGSAFSASRFGPLALAGGMVFSFASVGFLLAVFGIGLGLDEQVLRILAGSLLVVVGIVMLFEPAKRFLERALSRFANKSNKLSNKIASDSLLGNALLGALLGAIWSPCSGPTLGIALALATQSGSWLDSLSIFLFFGLGSATPLLLYAYGFRKLLSEKRAELQQASGIAQKILGSLVLLSGLLVVSGSDKQLEIWFLDNIPETWLDLITRY